MIVNHELRFAFFHVPKTAGTAIMRALAKLPGSADMGTSKHLTPVEFARYRPELAACIMSSYFRFCFVRDPWERFGSLHRFLHMRPRAIPLPADLNDFAAALEAREPWLMRMHSIKPQHVFTEGLSFIGRFEQLEWDLAHIAQLIGRPDLRIKSRNVSGERICYRDRMTARSQAIIAEFYKEDIERFGYHAAPLL